MANAADNLNVNTLNKTTTKGVQVGTPTGGDKGAGTLNVQGTIYQNGTAISSTGTGIAALFLAF